MDSGKERREGAHTSDPNSVGSANEMPPYPQQPGKLRLLFALAFAVTLAWRLGDAFLPSSLSPLLLAAIALGAPLAGALAAIGIHRGLFEAIHWGPRERIRPSERKSP